MNQDHLMFICIIAVAVIAVYAIVKFADRVLPKPILPMGESDDEDGDEYAPKCESCGVPFREHLGLIGTCKQLHEQRAAEREILIGFCNYLDVTHGENDSNEALREIVAEWHYKRMKQACDLRDSLSDQLESFGTELRRQKQEAWMRGDLQTASRIAVLIGDAWKEADQLSGCGITKPENARAGA